ncbi:MAG TPA: M13 family metallopeptidase [Polyangia bacterium]|nr:M13 family metallopeptidase [Polyangia bacterium]
MRRLLLAFVVVAGCGHEEAAKPAAPVAQAAPPVAPPAPIETGLDETAIDTSVNPCDDFYQYACGNWLKRTEIPADKSSWGRGFSVIDEHNEDEMHGILEAASKGQVQTQYADKIGALYATCMDEAGIESSAPTQLKQQLKRIEIIRDQPSLQKEVARIHLTIGNPMFDFTQQQDFKDATQVIGGLDQGGLGLPDRDYYLATTGKMPEIKKAYQAHVEKMLTLAGEPAKQAAKDAETVLKIETQMAQASMSKVDQRDPNKVYHRLELAGIEKVAPKWNWKSYLKEMGIPEVTQINVTAPDFFANLNKMLTSVPIADWKAYLKWHLVHSAAPALSKAFVDENFAFYGRTLSGQKELEPRWKRCTRSVDRLMGEALGRAFVEKTFGADGKDRTVAMVREIEAAMNANLDGLKWFDDATRAQAHEKLQAIANKIGYPDKWRNYDALEIGHDSYLANAMHAEEFEVKRQLAKIGKPVDRNEWLMSPPTVNAYYDPSMNEMVFPAGILQPPFFNRAAVKPVNYGAIGMVMGHELTHGFDDQGRQFDAKGNLRDWWSAPVGKEFVARAQCVVDQYSGYVAVDDLHLNGKLTLGENIADLGGLKLAHTAYEASKGTKAPQQMGKYTDEQLFWLGAAQSWCTKRRPERARMLVTVDPHSPPQFRIDGPLSNLPEFSAAFQCKAGDKMVRKTQCTIW